MAQTLVEKARRILTQTPTQKADLILKTLTNEAILRDPKVCQELLCTAQSFYHDFYHHELHSKVPAQTINKIYRLKKKINTYSELGSN